jgi:hypothetical protein
MVVTRVLDRSVPPPAIVAQPLLTFATSTTTESASIDVPHPTEVPLSRVLTSDFANGGGGRLVTKRDEIVPLTAELRRVHFNVGTQVVKKLEAARDGLSHTIRDATMEQVLEAALDLLLEKQARSRGQVKRPRKLVATTQIGASTDVLAPANRPAPATQPNPTPISSAASSLSPSPAPAPAEPSPDGSNPAPSGQPAHRRTGPRETISAAVKRAVWARDRGRCCWPLDSGGVCGSTHRLEMDHIDPWAREGGSTVANLRVVCASHNRLAARRAFGARWMGRYQGDR